MSRKTASFSQLLNYLNNGKAEKDDYFFRYNIYSHQPYFIIKEFQENYKNLKRQKNSNALYHEVISLKHQNNLSVAEQRKILKDLMEQYVKARANFNLVYGVIHEQHNQVHCHLMISSNELSNDRNKRLSKKQLAEIKENLQNYAHAKYPKLEREKKTSKIARVKARAKTKTIDNEVQMKKRTGKASERELTKERVRAILMKSKNAQEFIKALQAEKIQIYQRGKKFGFLDEITGKKYRLKTLELENEFSELNSRITGMTKDKPHDSDPNKTNSDSPKGKSGKDYIREKVLEIFTKSKSYNDFLAKLEAEQIQIYRAYDKFGFIDKMTNWKYRLDTLGLEKEFEKFFAQFDDEKTGKDYIKNIIAEILPKAKSHSEFITYIQNNNIQIYRINNTFGFIDNITQRRYRLETLELEMEFKHFLLKIDNEKKVVGKEYVRDKIKAIFSNSNSYDEFLFALKEDNIQIYRLYDSFGFADKMTDWKYTLESLGLENEFKEFLIKTNNDNTSFTKKFTNFAKRMFHEVVTDIQYFATGKKPILQDEVWLQPNAGEQDKKRDKKEEFLKEALNKEKSLTIEQRKQAQKEAEIEDLRKFFNGKTNKITNDAKRHDEFQKKIARLRQNSKGNSNVKKW